MRSLVYYVASTVDGFIAREDGSFDFFLSEGEHFAYLFSEYPETLPGHLRETLNVHDKNKHFDTVLMGRRTYDVGLKLGITSPYSHLKQYVFSRSISESPHPDIHLMSSEDPVQIVRELKRGDGLDIWLCGGGELASSLFSEIDEVILKVNPIVIGSGTPLFARSFGPTRLDLLETKAFDNGFVINRYRIAH